MLKLARLCVVLHSLEIAFKTTKALKDSTHEKLTEQFERACNDAISKYPRTYFKIRLDSFNRAKELNDFFFKNLLKLSGYKVENIKTIDSIIDNLLEKNLI